MMEAKKCHHGIPLTKECVSIQCDTWNHTKYIPEVTMNKIYAHIPGCLLEHNAPCKCPELSEAGKLIGGLLKAIETILNPASNAKDQFDAVEFYKYAKEYL